MQRRYAYPAITTLALAALFSSTAHPEAPPALEVVEPVRPGADPMVQAIREARYWQQCARQAVVREQEELAHWDPAADEPGPSDQWRQRIAQDRSGCLRRARLAAERAARLARSRQERYRAALVQACLECEGGNHPAELQQAQRLMKLAPEDLQSMLWLRRAARCNGLTSLEQRAQAELDRAGME